MSRRLPAQQPSRGTPRTSLNQNMNYVSLSIDVAVGDPPQSDEEVRTLAEAEFHSILNLRTADENGGLSPREEGISAREAGLHYLSYPIGDDELDEFHISSFRTKLGLLPAPTYVHGGNLPKAAALSLIDHAQQRSWFAGQAIQCAEELGLPCSTEPWESLLRDRLGTS